MQRLGRILGAKLGVFGKSGTHHQDECPHILAYIPPPTTQFLGCEFGIRNATFVL